MCITSSHVLWPVRASRGRPPCIDRSFSTPPPPLEICCRRCGTIRAYAHRHFDRSRYHYRRPALSFAWTAPTASPPGANVASPINVSSTAQLKNGTLGVNALGVFGNTILNGTNGDGTGNGVNSYLNFGATAGQSGYGIRDNNGTLEFKSNSGSWGSLNVTLTNLMQVNGITSNGLGQITSIKFGDGTTQTTAASANPWSTNGTSIYYNGGNVGIGTASPQINLDIQSSTSVGLNLVAPQNANSFLHLYHANGTGAGWAIGRTLNTDNLVFNWDDSPGHVQYTFFSINFHLVLSIRTISKLQETS